MLRLRDTAPVEQVRMLEKQNGRWHIKFPQEFTNMFDPTGDYRDWVALLQSNDVVLCNHCGTLDFGIHLRSGFCHKSSYCYEHTRQYFEYKSSPWYVKWFPSIFIDPHKPDIQLVESPIPKVSKKVFTNLFYVRKHGGQGNTKP